jgi:type I restriction enzyme, S subunit
MPKVRFREFRGGASWTIETLEDALAMSATYGIVTAGEFQKRGIPMLRGGDIKEGRIGDGLPFVTAEINSQYRRTILQANDVVISLVGYPGEAAVVPPRYVGANISRAVGLLRVKHLLSAPFLVCYLNSPAGKRTVLKPSAGSAQVVVNLKQLNSLLIPTPAPAEQQKIADCLSSVDEVIAAQARTVDALKTHKKGLMQQLFPREGETQPRLRFPEFQNAGEWEVKPLSEVTSAVFDGTHQTPTYTTSGIPFYSVENLISGNANKFISKEDYDIATKKNKPEKGDILLTRIGKIGFSQVVTWEHEFSVYVTLAVIKKSNAFDSHYMQFMMQCGRYQTDLRSKSLLNAVPPKINMDSLRATKVILPPSLTEQQRIATSLSSLDALITAETQKHEALKTHKRGLMQQLFPSPEDSSQ